MKRLFGFLCARGSKSILDVTAAALGMVLCAALVMLAMPVASYGQDTGYISGTVTDKSGAAIALVHHSRKNVSASGGAGYSPKVRQGDAKAYRSDSYRGNEGAEDLGLARQYS